MRKLIEYRMYNSIYAGVRSVYSMEHMVTRYEPLEHGICVIQCDETLKKAQACAFLN